VIGLRGSRCAEHRVALVDFVDRREAGPATGAALEHLDRCRTCEWELTDITIAIVALRRIQRETRDVEPAREAWVRIRARITRRPVALWRWRMTLAGLMASASLVGALVGPLAIDDARHGARISEAPIETVAPGMATVSPADWRIEREFIVAARQTVSRDVAGTLASDPTRVGQSQRRTTRIYADGIRVVGEEVAITEANGRPPGVS
jgi:hypothetical protein